MIWKNLLLGQLLAYAARDAFGKVIINKQE